MTFYRGDLDLEAVGAKEGVQKGWLKRKRAVKEYKMKRGAGKTHIALKLYEAIKQGGFTYDPIHAQSPKQGYSVSMTKQFETIYDATKITPQHVINFLQKTQPFVQMNKNAHLGGWVDTERQPVRVYLDVPAVHKDFNKAVAQGKALGELGIYGLKEGKTFDLQKMQWIEPKLSTGGVDLKTIKWKAAKEEADEAAFQALPDSVGRGVGRPEGRSGLDPQVGGGKIK